MVEKDEKKSEAIRQEKYIGGYFDPDLYDGIESLALIKTSQTGVKHKKCDILRIAVIDLLKKNGLLATSDQEHC